MKAIDILDQIRTCGGDVALLQDGYRMELKHRERIPDDLAAEAKAHAADLRGVLKEWHVDCPKYVVAHASQNGATFGACLSCGGSWELHGKPQQSAWLLIDDSEAVKHVAANFVLLRARNIVRSGR